MNTEQERADFEAWVRRDMPRLSLRLVDYFMGYTEKETQTAFLAYQAGRAALQSQAQIPAPTNRDEYIALLDRAIDMGKQLNVMWEEAFSEVGVKHGLQSQEYTASIGHAGQTYLDQFKNAHALPAEFRWSELWEVMCVAANKGRTDATQSQDREDAERYRWLRDKSRVFKQDPDMSGNHYWMVGINGALRGATIDAAIDHARRIEGDGE